MVVLPKGAALARRRCLRSFILHLRVRRFSTTRRWVLLRLPVCVCRPSLQSTTRSSRGPTTRTTCVSPQRARAASQSAASTSLRGGSCRWRQGRSSPGLGANALRRVLTCLLTPHGASECSLMAHSPSVRPRLLISNNRNTVHWGSACNTVGAGNPRRSVAVTFRRADLAPGAGHHGPAAAQAAPTGGAAEALSPAWLRGGLLSREQAKRLNMTERLKVVAQGLLLYSRWYSIPAELPLPLVKMP